MEQAGVLTICDISTIYREDTDDVRSNLKLVDSYYGFILFDSMQIESGLFTDFLTKSEDAQVILKSDHLRESVQGRCDCHIILDQHLPHYPSRVVTYSAHMYV